MDGRTYIYYNENGTFKVIQEYITTPVSGVITVTCFLIAVAYNFIVSVAIVSSNKLRILTFYEALALVSIVCFLDSLINESITFSFLFNVQTVWCKVSATVFHFFLIVHSTALCLLWLERTLALYDNTVTISTYVGGVLSVWAFGLIVVSLLLNVSDIHYFPNRAACGAIISNYWFPIFLLLIFLLEWSFIAINFFILIRIIKKKHSEQKHLTALSIFPISNEDINNSPLPITQCNKNKISATVLFLYVILVLPQILTVLIDLFFSPSFLPDPWVDPRIPSNKIRSVLSNDLEILFLYLRFMYNAVVPITILLSDRDLRLYARLVFCCRRNVVSEFDSNLLEQQTTGPLYTVDPPILNTPVLFATPAGLHLRIPSIISSSSISQRISISGENIRLVSRFCDSVGSSSSEQQFSSIAKDSTKLLENSAEGDKRNVRFSSKVEAISPLESRAWSRTEVSSSSGTRVINSPLFVKDNSHN